MSLPRPSIVIFDMDGTTVRHINPWVLNLLERLDDMSYAIGGWVKKKFGFSTTPPMAGIVNRGRKPRLLVHRAIHWLRRKPVEQIVEPCPQVFEVLDFLKAHDIPMAIASNGLGAGYGEDILKEFELEPYFQSLVFRENIAKAKPHPDAIFKALDGLKRDLTNEDVVWFIGDRRKDMLAAIAAQAALPCQVVPIAYGLNAAVAILEKQMSADHIFVAYADLHKKLKQLFH